MSATTKKKTKYQRAVEWIALNDETGETDPFVFADLVSVVLIADVFGMDPRDVTRHVFSYRRRQERKKST